MTTTGTRTWWHLVDPSWTPGTDLLCRDRLAELGSAPAWKWQDIDEGTDSSVVCLFADGDPGDDMHWMRQDYPDLLLVRVDLPDDADVTLVTVAEGYTAVLGRIPAEYLTLTTD